MQELEQHIAAWRARMAKELVGQEAVLDELEAHLRDHIEVQMKRGMTKDEAMAQGIARIGEPQALARAFEREEPVTVKVRPVAVVYGLTGAGYAVIVAMMVWQLFHSQNLNYNSLLVVHVLAISGGYLAVIAAGLLGFWALLTGWRRVATERELRTQRREIFRMSITASILVPVGLVLGAIWAARYSTFGAWSWKPVEVGALCVLISTWLLLLMQVRPLNNEKVRAVLALLSAVVVGGGWFASALTSIVPITWLYGSVIIGQGAVALIHERAKRGRAELSRPARE